jgi:hypothetical protein
MPHRRRIWCETVPCEALSEPSVRALLRRFAVAPIVAVFPSTSVADLARALAELEGEGLPVSVWPMLADGDGRWANAGNAEAFARFTLSLVEELARLGRSPSEVAIDLEPSIEDLRPSASKVAIHARFLRLSTDRGSFSRARERLRALGDALRERGVGVSAAAPPTALLDPSRGESRPFQELLGTPVDGLLWDHVSVMLYTSIIEGWSRGVLRREDTRALLGALAALAVARFGEQAGVSLGAVGVGAFGDEPVYRSVDELADDVAIALAAGALDLTLFELGGVLRRKDPEAWLEAFTRAEPAPRVPAPTLRIRAVLQAARLAGGGFGVLRGLR